MKVTYLIVWLGLVVTGKNAQESTTDVPETTVPEEPTDFTIIDFPPKWWTRPPPPGPLPPSISYPGYFTVVGPRAVHPGRPYKFVITNFHYPGNLKLSISLQDTFGQVLDQRKGSIREGDSIVERFKIPENFTAPKYYINVTAPAISPPYTVKKELNVLTKEFSIFIQTDKPIYKPGDLVRFRIFAVDSITRPVDLEEMVVTLLDPESNTIKVWDNLTIEFGFFEDKVQLADSVKTGFWKLKVEDGVEEYSKLLEIKEYVLPRFQVSVSTPENVFYYDGKLPVTVNASYTFGRPLKGSATISFLRWGWDLAFTKTMEVDGSTTTEINLNDVEFQYFGLQNGVINVEFTDPISNKVMFASTSFTIHFKRYQIVYNTVENQGNYTVTITVKLFNGRPGPPGTILSLSRFVAWNIPNTFIGNFTLNSASSVIYSFQETNNQNLYYFLTAKYEDAEENIYIYPSFPPTPTVTNLEIKLLTSKIELDEPIKFKISSSEPVPFVVYNVFAKGNLFRTRKVPLLSKEATISFSYNFWYVPEMQIIVYYVKKVDGAVVTATLTVPFRESLPNFVSLNLSNSVYAPGDNVSLTINTLKFSFVSLSAIDQSVLLMNQGHDVTSANIFDELYKYDLNQFYWEDAQTYFGDYYSEDVFENTFSMVRAFIATNVPRKYRHYEWRFTGRQRKVGQPDASIPMQMEMQTTTNLPTTTDIPREPQTPAPLPAIRKDFSEVFLWETLEVFKKSSGNPEQGKATISAKVPDTITSWVLSAISLHDDCGIGILEPHPSFTVFKAFFVEPILPYSMKRREELKLDIVVYNYLSSAQNTVVTVTRSDTKFEAGNFAAYGWNVSATGYSQRVNIPNGNSKVLRIPIIPKVIGSIPLKISAISSAAGDIVEKPLRVIPEGIPQSINNASFIQKSTPAPLNLALTCNLPPNAVNDTISVEASVIGNILGNTLNNLAELIQMPYGCGEQNMLNFVPNIVILIYLQNSNQLTQTLREKIVAFTEKGYQQELQYQRSDGSFSAFGNSDSQGSTWLTAYVLKSFTLAQPFVSVDSKVILSAKNFLISKQDASGEFIESGVVYHTDMQGEAARGVGLTAYVAIILAILLPNHPELSTSLSKSLNFVAANVNTNDVYSLAISAYALHVGGHPNATLLLNQLNTKAKETPNTLNWEKLQEMNKQTWWYSQPRSLDVEITAYALQLYLTLPAYSGKILKIVRWLIAQRNNQGGFMSTQDTVVGLEALGKFALLLADPGSLNLGMTPNVGGSFSATVNKNNSLVVQKFQLSEKVRSLSVTASGTGFAIVQLSCNFYIVDQETAPRFNISLSYVDSCVDRIQLKICVNFIPDKNNAVSNMVIVIVTLPSGFEYDKEAKKDEIIKRIETEDGGTTVTFYLDGLSATPVCIVVPAFKNVVVDNPKNSTIEVRDYYDTTRKASIPYLLPTFEACV